MQKLIYYGYFPITVTSIMLFTSNNLNVNKFQLTTMNVQGNLVVVIFINIIFFLSISVIDCKSIQLKKSLVRTKRELIQEPCCVLPLCTDSFQCYQTISCGHLCTKRELVNKRNEDVNNSDYQIRVSYHKRDCRLERCLEVVYSCRDCPNPDKNNFNINSVTALCKPCYYS